MVIFVLLTYFAQTIIINFTLCIKKILKFWLQTNKVPLQINKKVCIWLIYGKFTLLKEHNILACSCFSCICEKYKILTILT